MFYLRIVIFNSRSLIGQLNSSNKESPSEDKTVECIASGLKLAGTDILSLQQETVSGHSRPHSDTESVSSLKFTVTDLEPDVKDDSPTEPDEFGGFESSKPDDWSFPGVSKEDSSVPTLAPSDSWSHMQPLRETYISDNLAPNIIDEGNWLGSTINSPELPRKVEKTEEDDFSDFQMVLPQPQPQISVPPSETALPPVEPLKPIVLQPTVIPTAPTKINWPEPGIVDDTTIDLTYSKTQTDEDDWCDFVSVPRPEPKENVPETKEKVSETKISDPFSLIATTSNFSNLLQSITTLPSGQLELSVPNLQNTHLKYNALPAMQAPNAVRSLNSPPSTQQIAAQQVQHGYQPPYQIPLTSPSSGGQFGLEPTEIGPAPVARPRTQPSRSEQTKQKTSASLLTDLTFMSPKKESQAQNTVFTPVQNVENTFLKMQQSALPSNNDDEDEWSDFVSNQSVSVSELSNGWKGEVKVSKQNLGWSSDVTPNIITNPVHFDVFQSYQPLSTNQRKSSILSTPKNVPSISTLPELDFIAPKNKFFTKK